MPLPDRITVLGAGSWGTALAVVLCHNIKKVTLWGRSSSHTSAINQARENQRYLPGINLPANLSATADIESAVADHKDFLVAVPSRGFRETITDLGNLTQASSGDSPELTIVSATKGFDPASNGLLSDTVRHLLGESVVFGVISGPSFARETAAAMPTALTVACNELDQARRIAEWFKTPSTRVYFSDDPVGVQLGGAIKNVMAIAAGISDGLGYGANARSALITRGLSEMGRLGKALGGRPETFMGLTGVGDLILTCTDNQSRNRRYGMGIGAGTPQEEILREIGQEVEGMNTVRELYNLSLSQDIDMPITEQVYKIIYQGKAPATAVQELLSRAATSE